MGAIELARQGDIKWARGHDWKLVIGGELKDATNGAVYSNESPLLRGHFCDVPDAGQADVDDAVRAGEEAVESWREVPVRERAAVVRSLVPALREHGEEFAVLDAIDTGNTVTSMLGDLDTAIETLELMADMAFELAGKVMPASNTHFNYTRYEPYGVTARIVAFNHPTLNSIMKIAAPLVAGNAIIMKPSDSSPLTNLWVGEVLAPQLPKGLLSVITCNGVDTSRAIVRHPGIRRIGFIGSQSTGRAIQRDAADVGVKNITLELGGKNALIVCEDFDPDRAAAIAVKGMNFAGWQSQSCGSTSRLFVHEDIADAVVAAIVDRVRRITIGSPFDPDTVMGSLASRAQFDKTPEVHPARKGRGRQAGRRWRSAR